jgi:drug/metabolite transporter (DMT)-like permease
MKFAPAPDIGPLLPGTMPLFVALIGVVMFHERLGGWRGLGMALIAIGVLCIGGRGLADTANGSWRGHVLFLAGALMWGIYTHAYRRSGLDPLKAAAIVGLWSIVILLPFGASSLVHALASGLAGPIVLQAILQGFLSGVVATVLYGVAIDRLGASQAAALSPLGPVLATLLAVPLLGEYPDAAALVGLIVAAAGVVLASGIVRGDRWRKPADPTPPATAAKPRAVTD